MDPNICKDHAPRPHNEFICHATGEKRQNIINKLKMILDQSDDRPCLVPDLRSPTKPLMKYPGYIDPHHPAFKPIELNNCQIEFDKLKGRENPCKDNEANEHQEAIRNITEALKNMPDCKRMKMQANEEQPKRKIQETYMQEEVSREPCICVKANGLQDQCPLLGCKGKPECVAVNPGPCCKPGLTYLCEAQMKRLQEPPRKQNPCAGIQFGGPEPQPKGNHYANTGRDDTHYGDIRQEAQIKQETIHCDCYFK